MPKEEWGVKRVCPKTGKRFYDLNKDPVISPYTGEVVILDEDTKARTAIESKAEKSAEKDVDVDDDDLLVDDEDSSDSDLDDDLLDDDDDNVSLDDIADVASDDDDS